MSKGSPFLVAEKQRGEFTGSTGDAITYEKLVIKIYQDEFDNEPYEMQFKLTKEQRYILRDVPAVQIKHNN